ncbi:hypothetical protein [Leclercia adecarboxylata]|uniref:hypothetical protein n=1 Tax=Leclercia adecarboxylata TaxID=83655 RepID=UPI0025504DEB|nr:hypothetical protein [Leclercia adecarboxylata]
MTTTVRKLPLKQILYNYRHILIPALAFTIELTVWATLNLKGLGDKGWVYWRVFLLLSVFLVVFSGSAFEKDDELFLMFGSVIPWVVMLILSSVYGFIQMNLNFLTLDLFFVGVLGSTFLQALFTVVHCIDS